jgi:hypothetical protein
MLFFTGSLLQDEPSSRFPGESVAELMHAQRPLPATQAVQRHAAGTEGMAGRLNDGEGPVQLRNLSERMNATGLPDGLKAGIEKLSGFSLDQVRVRYNSARPAALQAHAFTQGSEIHVAPGQERHLAHEAWHVVQQAQGRVRPTAQLAGGVPLNDDAGLEREADLMGSRALAAS